MPGIEAITDAIIESLEEESGGEVDATLESAAPPADASAAREMDHEWSLAELRSEEIEENRLRAVGNRRVGKLSYLLAKTLHEPAEFQQQIRTAAQFHDIGKIWIPDEILEKPGPLTDDEYETVKEHTRIGASLLSRAAPEAMTMAIEIARSHHERWDGTGYPDGLSEDDIPFSARIVAVADTLDAMTSDRPYRNAVPAERAFSVIEAESGAQFDPRVVDAALLWREAVGTLMGLDGEPTEE